MSHREALLAVMRASRAELEAAVDAHRGRLDAELGVDWRVRDTIAHIAVWEQMAVRKLTGAPLPVGDDLAARKPWNLNTFNNAMRDRWRALTDDEILAAFASAHQALLTAVEGAPDQQCAPGGKVWKTVDEDSAGHYHFHFPIPDLMADRWPQETEKE